MGHSHNEPPASPGRVPIPTGYVEFDRAAARTVVERFEQQVSLHENRPAVQTDGERLTYRDLNQAANRVAHAILERRPAPVVRPNAGGLPALEDSAEPVAVLTQQGSGAAKAALGAFKAGKVYVPLDPADPPRRIRQILGEVCAGLIVTDADTHALARELASDDCAIIDIDAIRAGVADVNPEIAISPDDLAYVIFTSGSTGRPKGVMHIHRALLHDIAVKSHFMYVTSGDRFSLVSAGTGHAIKNLMLPLLNGAALYPRNVRREGTARVASWLMRNEITVFTAAPPLFRSLLDSLSGAERFPHLRLIRVGGDCVYAKDVERFQWHFSEFSVLVNEYGSSETGSICAFVCDGSTRIGGPTAAVGYPVGDTELMLLDDRNEPVAPGQPGAIAVRSTSLSPGYWRQPELTRQTFIPDPLEDNARIYRSADMGRFLPDGMLVLIGRTDFQVKVRGFSVNPAEVESTLLTHHQVQAAVVHPWTDHRSETRLVSYIVPAKGAHPAVDDLRSHVASRLAEYMVPAFFVMLDSLPVLPGGKVDRQALPEPGRTRPELNSRYVPAHSFLERRLADIWGRVLHRDKVGVHDSFFDLGGDSLLAATLNLRIAAELNADLSLPDLLRAPTVAEAAALLERRLDGAPPFDGRLPSAALCPGERAAGARRRFQAPGFARPAHIDPAPVADFDQLCEVIRPGSDDRPVACVGDTRPIAHILARLGDDVPVWHLKLDGTHVWPPRYLSLDQQAYAHAQVLESRCARRQIALVGFSYGGLVAYRVASELAARGWTDVKLLLIEPIVGSRYQAGWHRLRGVARVLLSEAAVSALLARMARSVGWMPADRAPTDIGKRWAAMRQHYRRNALVARLPRLGRPIALVASKRYHARNGSCWQKLEPGTIEARILADAHGHFGCFSEPHSRQLTEWLGHWYYDQ